MPIVTFVPFNKAKVVKPGATLLAAANQAHVPLGQSCSGDGICGWCRVKVLAGLANLSPPSPLERKLIREKMFGADERAASLAVVRGDVSITITYW